MNTYVKVPIHCYWDILIEVDEFGQPVDEARDIDAQAPFINFNNGRDTDGAEMEYAEAFNCADRVDGFLENLGMDASQRNAFVLSDDEQEEAS